MLARGLTWGSAPASGVAGAPGGGPPAPWRRLLAGLVAVAVAALSCLGAGAPVPAARAATAVTAARTLILRAAESQLGYTEKGDYCSRFGECDPWCALFLTWVWQRAGVPIPRYPFVGDVWQWALRHGAVVAPRATPVPGDAVFYGTGPSSVNTALHIGLIEAVYPRYLVTVEGDVFHGVRRMVVPRRGTESIGEPGPIWGYGSPFGAGDARGVRGPGGVMDPDLAAVPRAIPTLPDPGPPDRGERILGRTLHALAPFQHLPASGGGYRAGWTGVDATGHVLVHVSTLATLARAQAWWAAFVRRWGGRSAAFVVSYRSAPNPPASVVPPAISGSAVVGMTLTAVPGTWSAPTSRTAYEWLRCADASTATCAPIAGARGTAYVPGTADLGGYLRVAEAASNRSGSGGPVLSAPVGPVMAAPLS